VTLAAVMLGLFGLGSILQPWRGSTRARDVLWSASFFVLAPSVSFAGFSTVSPGAGLLRAIVAAIVATWSTFAVSRAYARWADPSLQRRGALTLAGAFGNTGFLGLPVAHLFLGEQGVSMMAVYSQLQWMLPEIAVSAAVAEHHGIRGRTLSPRFLVRYLLSPPMLVTVLTIVARIAGVDTEPAGRIVGPLVATVAGPFGFLLLGLSIPLAGWIGSIPSARDLGALVIKHGVSPLLLVAIGASIRVDLPAAFALGASMPCAFNLVVLARVFELEPQRVRWLVVVSTSLAFGAILVALMFRWRVE
jgi:predicted permease